MAAEGKVWDVVVVGAGPSGCFAAEVFRRAGLQVLIIDAGPAGIEPTSVIDLSGGTAEILRVGRGDLSGLN